MKLSVAAPFFPSFRLLAAVALAMSASLAIPATLFADCWKCAYSNSHPWPSHMCKQMTWEDDWGRGECKEVHYMPGHTRCKLGGLPCMVIIITVAHDQEAISKVMAGESLPADGFHFFVVDGDDAVLMRKCDLTVVARIPHRQIPRLNAESAIATDSALEPRPRAGLVSAAIAMARIWIPWR